ncbi:hypothetical protein [Pseudomonas fulva]|uniref:hypothetical protein n=1 Tax=Pseudomonas fulva TaxID=47880 RepID=UPI003BF5D9AA
MSNRESSSSLKPPSFEKPELEFDDAVRFFQTVCDEARCPACGSRKWEIPTTEENDEICLVVRSGIVGPDGSPVFNLAIECRICGFVRVHRADFLLEWVEQNPEHDELDDDYDHDEPES